eukprot:c13345_g1_i2.p1 GENE.c13345_g1_i2~~c13345_g1_i2.p1  ORF type:complete len:744 (+),score=304.65 c13345_g1_i2:35-2233(+)
MMKNKFWFCLLFVLVFFINVVSSKNKNKKPNKFVDRSLPDSENLYPSLIPTEEMNTRCPNPMSVLWSRELESSIYATPVISDLDGDGHKEIIVSTYAQFIDVVDAKNGHSKRGWPFSMEGANFHSSPDVVDVDGDGSLEIVIVSFDGEVLVFGKNGVPYLSQTIQVPKLKVRKNWYSSAQRDQILAEFVPASERQESKTLSKLKSGLHHDHSAHNPPILPFSDNEAEATVQMPFGEDGQQSFRELFMAPEKVSGKNGTETPNSIVEGDYVFIDSHVLCSSAINDIDQDGHMDIILAVSYFFDRETFDFSRLKEGNLNIDIGKYIAGGIVVIDLKTGNIKWSLQLDLTTEDDEYHGYIYSTPTVVDLDGDGEIEIIVGTSMGKIYVLNSKGEIRAGFPVEMAEIQGQVAVSDVNSDGKLEILACDANYNIAVFDCDGNEIWEKQLFGMSAHGVIFADVNMDGQLDVVVTTSNGYVFALNQHDGAILPFFPIKLPQRVVSPALPIRISSRFAYHSLVIPCFDGHLYVIHGTNGCVSSVDIGEHVYTMVLADDLTGNNKMDLIVTTMNGMIYCLSTDIPYNSLRSWTSQNFQFNGFSPREGGVAIKVSSDMKNYGDIVGSTFPVSFEIIDARLNIPHPDSIVYSVKIKFGQIILFQHNYTKPGTYLVTVESPKTRVSGIVRVELEDRHKIHYVDTFSISFNKNFHQTLKWIVVLPFTIMVIVIFSLKEFKTPLPS